LVGEPSQDATLNSTIMGLGNRTNNSEVIQTVIVTMPDKNSQFLRQARLKGWNIPET
jgi:hypothetical protein